MTAGFHINRYVHSFTYTAGKGMIFGKWWIKGIIPRICLNQDSTEVSEVYHM